MIIEFCFYEKHIVVLKMKMQGFNCVVFFFEGKSDSSDVLTACLGKKSFVLIQKMTDKAGRALILDITLDADQYILIDPV